MTSRLRTRLAITIAAAAAVIVPVAITPATAAAAPTCHFTNPMRTGQSLCTNQVLFTPGGLLTGYYLKMQSDGNLVYYSHNAIFGTDICWASNTVGRGKYMEYANHTMTVYDAHYLRLVGINDGGGTTININSNTGDLYVGNVRLADC